jgi:hypothetical protein
MLQALQMHVAGVVLQRDVALKAYISIVSKCFESMLQVLQAHVADVVFYLLRMLQQRYYTCFNSNLGMFQ